MNRKGLSEKSNEACRQILADHLIQKLSDSGKNTSPPGCSDALVRGWCSYWYRSGFVFGWPARNRIPLGVARRFNRFPFRPHARPGYPASRPFRRASRWRAHWYRLLPCFRRCAMGLRAGTSAGPVFYVTHQDGSSARRCKSHPDDLRPCWLVCALATSSCRGDLACRYCRFMEQVIPRPRSLSGRMA